MTRRAYLLTCAECGEATTSMTLICGKCAPKYENALMGDECGCADCLAAMPGVAVAGNDGADGRVQALNEISGAQP